MHIFTFNNELSIGTVIIFLGFLATSIGLGLNFLQLRRTAKVQRNDFLFKVTNDLFTDSEFRKFFYKIDYEKFKFDSDNPNNFKETDDERHLDALLYRYDLLSRLVRTKILTLSDIEFAAFEIVQVMKNTEVNKYLTWLDNEFDTYGSATTEKRARAHDDLRLLFKQIGEHK